MRWRTCATCWCWNLYFQYRPLAREENHLSVQVLILVSKYWATYGDGFRHNYIKDPILKFKMFFSFFHFLKFKNFDLIFHLTLISFFFFFSLFSYGLHLHFAFLLQRDHTTNFGKTTQSILGRPCYQLQWVHKTILGRLLLHLYIFFFVWVAKQDQRARPNTEGRDREGKRERE